MEGSKKIVFAVVLIMIIVFAIVWISRRGGGRGTIERPNELTGQMEEKIDARSGKIFTKTMGEWEKLDYSHMGYVWKNPETGEFTVVNIITCPHCGERIPDRLRTVKEIMDPAAMEPQAQVAAAQAYTCPKCGGKPLLPGPPSGGPMGGSAAGAPR